MADRQTIEARHGLRNLRRVLAKKEPIGTKPFVECPHCKSHCKRAGSFVSMTHGKTQRFRCTECGRTFAEGRKPVWYRGIHLSVHFRKTHQRLKYAIDLLVAGASQRETERKAELQRDTVIRLRSELRTIGMLPTFCTCGKAAGHNGWCQDRYQRSARRQAALAELHERQRRAKL